MTVRGAASCIKRTSGLKLRDYIRQSLYSADAGYFSNATPPVLSHPTRLHFPALRTRAAYNRAVHDVYSSHAHGWMTPVELFSPHLSRAIANRLALITPHVGPVAVVEFGGGRGTLATDILQHWADTAPALLERVTYHLVEISPILAAFQSRELAPWISCGKACVHHADAAAWLADLQAGTELGGRLRDSSCHIVATEVLDNLPHDLVRASSSGEWEQGLLVRGGGDLDYSTAKHRLEWDAQVDAETLAAIKAFNLQTGLSRAEDVRTGQWAFGDMLRRGVEQLIDAQGAIECWVPTVAYQLLREICKTLPHASLTISDFDSLPGCLPGKNAPIVQRVVRGNAIVYDSIESAPVS